MSRDKKNISVKEFIDNYKKLTSDTLKDNYIKSIIYRTYVPVLEKKLFLQVMFDNSLIGEEPNRYVDAFLNQINTTIAILQLYTDLDMRKNEGDKSSKTFEIYDMLASNDLLNLIFNEIPSSELKSILAINEQISETFYNQNNSTEAFLTKLVDRFSNTFGAITNGSIVALLEVLNDEEKMNSIISKAKKNVNFNDIIQIIKNNKIKK